MKLKIMLSGGARLAFSLILAAGLLFASGQAIAGDILEKTKVFLWLSAIPGWVPSVLLIAGLMGLSWLGLVLIRRWLPADGHNKKNKRIGYYAVAVAALVGILLSPFVTNLWKSYLSESINFLPPSAAGNVAVALSWNPSTAANVGGYKVYYGTSSGVYTTSVNVGNNTSYQISGLQQGTPYFFAVTAYDLSQTVEGSPSAEITAIATTPVVDFTASQTSGNAPMTVSFTPTVTEPVTSWQWNFGDGTTNAGSTSTVPNAIKSYGSPGTYTVSLTVTGSAGNITQTYWNLVAVAGPSSDSGTSTSSTSGTATSGTGSTTSGSTSGATASGTNGLVAAYGFDEIGGTTTVDASGNANQGTLLNAVRVSGGRFGNALQFNGTNAWVTVNDSSSLDLTAGMTMEAWVYPTTTMSGLNTIVMKEQPATATSAGAGAYLLAANNSTNQPMSAVWATATPVLPGGEVTVGGNMQIPANQWTHIAATYNGQVQCLYVNGVLIDTLPQTGAITTSGGLLRIGGNSVWGNYFQGYIDEVRIYNQAISNAQIISDAQTAVSVSKPPQLVAGDQNIESTVLSIPLGTAQAFQIIPQQTKMVTNIQVYVDASSTANAAIIAIYTNSNNHPYTALIRGGLSSLQRGAWNSIPLNPFSTLAGQTYWIGIMGTGGTLNLRGISGSGLGFAETGANNTYNLPSPWSTISAYNGLVSTYEAGY